MLFAVEDTSNLCDHQYKPDSEELKIPYDVLLAMLVAVELVTTDLLLAILVAVELVTTIPSSYTR